MLNINDDMDDLIRQAAEEYPLKIHGKDWDKVVGGIPATIESTPAKDNSKKHWWLLLLLPLLMAIPMYYRQHSVTTKQNTSANNQSTDRTANTTTKPSITAPVPTTGKTTGTVRNKVNSDAQQMNSPSNYSSINQKAISNTYTTSGKSRKQQAGLTKGNHNVLNNNTISTDVINDKTALNNTTERNRQQHNNTAENNDTQIAQTDLNPFSIKKNEAGEKEPTIAAADSSNNMSNAATTQQKDSAATVKKMTPKHTTPVKKKGLYIGGAAAMDITTVKFHEVNRLGYTTSLIVGYRINNNWSVETGLMWDSKKYYSPGKYFSKSNTGLPTDYNIQFLNGMCKMFELPVNVKYDFKSKQLSGFFIGAGLSSYIMKKESYNYFVTHESSPADPGYFKQKDYKNSTKNFFAVTNISGGYQFIFKNNHSLRIAPYLQIPLSGLGIGKLPFSSTGVTAAYTVPLHQ